MNNVARPRGPLPASVYWRRRALVLAIAFALVFSLGRVLGGGSDAKSDDTATQASAEPKRASTAPTPSATAQARTKPKLAQPDGACDPADLKVEPLIRRAVGGSTVEFKLALHGTAAACTFRASSKTIAVKIVSGSDKIWSTQQCPQGIVARDVIVRSAKPAKVPVVWSARRSDEGCTRDTDWARLGWYHVIAATLGGTPTDVQFELRAPTPPTVTVTPKPKAKKKR